LRERLAVFFFVVVALLRAVARFGDAVTADFARLRGALPFPLFPFERDRVCRSRCRSCVRSIFARPMTLPSGSAKSA
jgi:hypothetical protein